MEIKIDIIDSSVDFKHTLGFGNELHEVHIYRNGRNITVEARNKEVFMPHTTSIPISRQIEIFQNGSDFNSQSISILTYNRFRAELGIVFKASTVKEILPVYLYQDVGVRELIEFMHYYSLNAYWRNKIKDIKKMYKLENVKDYVPHIRL